jgi:predicted RNA binding protein YcfA (HicA-like mRNA interferase family)
MTLREFLLNEEKWPTGAKLSRVLKAFEKLGFQNHHSGKHIILKTDNKSITIPRSNDVHPGLLRTICTKVGIDRKKFLEVYNSV